MSLNKLFSFYCPFLSWLHGQPLLSLYCTRRRSFTFSSCQSFHPSLHVIDMHSMSCTKAIIKTCGRFLSLITTLNSVSSLLVSSLCRGTRSRILLHVFYHLARSSSSIPWTWSRWLANLAWFVFPQPNTGEFCPCAARNVGLYSFSVSIWTLFKLFISFY